KERRMQLMDETKSDTYASAEIGPTEAIERQESYSHVLQAMQTLSPNQQEVVRLKFQHGMSYKQISEVTDLSVTNVGFLLHTALKTLREKLGETADDHSHAK
ncbi:MAG TPA: sigma-70 family RNA polymerase sigma factor, partial [Tepidisphaeraceae bacterium]|nr:sigma-70 family RNA polymerase sigma factor [Tepidisphaeraceae bacterium]